MKRNNLLLLAILAVGAAAFGFVVTRRLKAAVVNPYVRPKGGEKIEDFEAFIGS